jgi:hypothetical protein
MLTSVVSSTLITTRNMKATGSARKVSLSLSQSEHMVLPKVNTPLEGSSDTATDYYPEGPSFYEEIAQAKHPDWTASSL